MKTQFHALTLVAMFLIMGVQNSFSASVFHSGCKVTKVQLQRLAYINGGSLPGSHNVVRVNLEKGATTLYAWFDIDDASGYGKSLLSLFLTASSTGAMVNVSLDDSKGTFQFVEDGPPSQVTDYVWAASLN